MDEERIPYNSHQFPLSSNESVLVVELAQGVDSSIFLPQPIGSPASPVQSSLYLPTPTHTSHVGAAYLGGFLLASEHCSTPSRPRWVPSPKHVVRAPEIMPQSLKHLSCAGNLTQHLCKWVYGMLHLRSSPPKQSPLRRGFGALCSKRRFESAELPAELPAEVPRRFERVRCVMRARGSFSLVFHVPRRSEISGAFQLHGLHATSEGRNHERAEPRSSPWIQETRSSPCGQPL